MWFIFLLSFIGMCYALHSFLALRWQQTPFVTLSIASVIVYLLAITGFLEYGAILSLALGILLGSYALHKEKYTIKITREAILPTALSLLPFVLISFAVKESYVFTAWDEFSFWGSSIKIIHETGALYNGDSAISYKDYPPLQQLIQYYFCYAFGWSEANVLRGHDLFILSAILFASATVIKKNSTLSAVAFISSTTFLYFFKYDLSHVLVDQCLGVIFLAALACALSDDVNVRRFVLPLTIFMLPVVKQMGLVFALFIVALQFINLLLSNKLTIRQRVKSTLQECIISCSVLLIAFKSWGWYLASAGVVAGFQKKEGVDFTSEAFQAKFEGTITTLFNRIHTPFFSSLHLSLVQTIIAALFLSLLVVVLAWKKNRLKAVISATALASMFFAYLLFLLYCYLAFFTEYESTRLAAFERYLGSFLLAWFCILTLYVVLLSWSGRNRLSYVTVFMLLVPFCLTQKRYFHDFISIKPEQKFIDSRNNVAKLVDEIYPLLKPKDKVYFIHQNSTGYEKNIFRYAVQPYAANSWCWTLGEKYYPGDIWTCPQNLQDVAKGYNYLVIYQSDEQFWKNNARYFSKKNSNDNTQGIYKIVWNGDKIESITTIKEIAGP